MLTPKKDQIDRKILFNVLLLFRNWLNFFLKFILLTTEQRKGNGIKFIQYICRYMFVSYQIRREQLAVNL